MIKNTLKFIFIILLCILLFSCIYDIIDTNEHFWVSIENGQLVFKYNHKDNTKFDKLYIYYFNNDDWEFISRLVFQHENKKMITINSSESVIITQIMTNTLYNFSISNRDSIYEGFFIFISIKNPNSTIVLGDFEMIPDDIIVLSK